MNAEGSTTGAGGMGTMSPWPTAAPFAGASQPQAGAGAGAAQVGAAQLGAAAAQPQPTALPQPLPQPLLQQRFLQHLLLQQLEAQHLLSQPQPQPPSIASSSSKPKLWVQTARASTNDPRSVVRFIERRLLNDGTIELAQAPVRPDHATRAATLAGSAAAFAALDRFAPTVRLSEQTLRVCDFG